MKKLFFMLLILFSFYLLIQIFFDFFSPGSDEAYEIKSGNLTFKISEVANFKDSVDNYKYSINLNGKVFSFQVFHNYNKRTNIIEDIKYFKNNNYECIFPIFKDNLNLTDAMCLNNKNVAYYYHNIKGKDSTLDNFISKLDGYEQKQFLDQEKSKTIKSLKVYEKNLIKNHFIGINNYKGLYDVSDNFNSVVYNISLFKKDVYNHKLSAFVDEYYLVADYEQQYNFNEFHVINLTGPDTFTIASDRSISHDSYIQGVVDGNVYLYDKDNKIQYQIDIKKKEVVQYSSSEIKYYKDGEWTTMSISEANSELKFTNTKVDYQLDGYVKIDKVGNEIGYYYLYKSNGSKYDVYRINIDDKQGLTYVFSVENLDNVFYVDNYVYFINKNKIQVFNNEIGIKTLLEYNELEFNENINFYVYSK